MASTAAESNLDSGGVVVAVEGDLGKECHALGVLFQQIVNELKVGSQTVDKAQIRVTGLPGNQAFMYRYVCTTLEVARNFPARYAWPCLAVA